MIYGLYSTTDNVIRYIGSSFNPQKRFVQHLTSKGSTDKDHWIRSNFDTIKMSILPGFLTEYDAIDAYGRTFPSILFNKRPGDKQREAKRDMKRLRYLLLEYKGDETPPETDERHQRELLARTRQQNLLSRMRPRTLRDNISYNGIRDYYQKCPRI